MKKLAFFALFFVFLGVGVWGADYYWIGSDDIWENNTNWADINNDPITGYPGSVAGDTAIFNNNAVVTISGSINASTVLTINTNVNLTLGVPLTLGTLEINNDAVFTFNGDSITTGAFNTATTGDGQTLSTDKTLTVTGVTELNGALNLTGSLIITNLTANSGSSVSGGSIEMAGAEVEIESNSVTISNIDSSTGTINATNKNVTLNILGTGSNSVSIGSITTSETTAITTSGTGDTLSFVSLVNATGNKTLTVGGTWGINASGISFYDVTIESNANVTLISASLSTTNFTNSGIFKLNNNSLNGVSTSTFTNTGTIESTNGELISDVTTIGGLVILNLEFPVSATSVKILSYNNLQINGTCETDAFLTVTGNLELTSSGDLTLNYNALAGTLYNAGIIDIDANTLTVTGALTQTNGNIKLEEGTIDAGSISQQDGTISITDLGTINSNGNVSQNPAGSISGAGATLTLSGTGSFSLTGGNDVSTLQTAALPNVPASINYTDTNGFGIGSGNVTSSGAVTLNAGTGALILTGNITGSGAVALTANGITGGGNIENTGNTVTLTTTGGAVNITGAVTGSTLTLNGNGAFTLNASNNIATLQTAIAPNAPTSIDYIDTDGFGIGSGNVTSSGAITLTAGTTNTLILTGSITSSGTDAVTLTGGEISGVGGIANSAGAVTLTATATVGDINIGGAVTGTNLTLRGSGSFTLDNTGNNIATLKTAALPTNIYPESISYRDTDGFYIDGLRAETSITLTAGGTVMQTGGIFTPTLTLSGNATFTLTGSGNNIDTLQTVELLPGNIYPTSISYTDTDEFDIGDEGLQTTTSITLTTGGAVTQTDNLTSNGAIATGILTLSGDFDFTLDNAYNNITTLVTNGSVGAITYKDTNGFAVGTNNANGVNSNGEIILIAGTSALTLTGSITGSGTDAVALTGNGITGGGNIDNTGYTINITTTGAAVNIGGEITGTVLTLSGPGSFDLNNVYNDIETLRTIVFSTNTYPESISYTDTDDFVIGGLQADTSITLTAGDEVTQTGGIITTILTLSGYVDFDLTGQGNNITTLQTTATHPKSIEYTETSGFGIGALQADKSVTLTSNGTVDQSGAITITDPDGILILGGSGVFELDNAGNNIAILETDTVYPTSIIYRDTNGFEIRTVLQADTSITLISGGTVTQTGDIFTETLTLSGNADFSLTGSSNNIAILQTAVLPTNIYPASINYKDADGFDIGDEGLQAAVSITLTAGGDVKQTNTSGAIITGTLFLSGNVNFELENSDNKIATLETIELSTNVYPASIKYRDNDGFAVGSGEVKSGGAITLNAGTDALTLTGSITGSGAVALTANGITGSGNIDNTGYTINIITTGAAVNIGGKITGTDLILSGPGSFTLNNEDNNVATLETVILPNDIYPESISYTDTDNFVIGGLKTDTTITLTSNDAVTQIASTTITTETLTLSGSGSFTLDNPDNNVTILQTDTTNPLSISYTNTDAANGFEIANLHTNGTSGTITLTSDGAVTQIASTTITTETLTLSGYGPFTLDNAGNDVSILQTGTPNPSSISYTNTDTNGFAIAGLHTNGTGTVMLTSDGAVTQSNATTITTGTLTLSGTGPFTLDNTNNNIATLETSGTTGAITYKDFDDFAVGTDGVTSSDAVDLTAAGELTLTGSIAGSGTNAVTLTANGITGGGNGDITSNGAGNTITLTTTGGNVEIEGEITGSTLTLDGNGSFVLNAGNNVAFLRTGAASPISIEYTDTDGFDIRGLQTTTAITLISGGNVTQLGLTTNDAIETPTLTLSGSAAFTLNNSNNKVNTFIINATGATNGNVEFTNSDNLIVDGINTSAEVTLKTGTGSNIMQTAKVIKAGKLILDSAGAITLNSDNEAGILSIIAAGGVVQFTNNAALAIAGIDGLTGATAQDQNVTIITTGSNISQTGAIKTIGMLTVNSSGAIILDAANEVGTIKITGAGGAVEFRNEATLIVDSISAVGRIVALTTNGAGNGITINGAINSLTLALYAAAGTVNIGNTITVTGGYNEHDERAGVYIKANSLTGSEDITLGTGWACAYIQSLVDYSGTVSNPGIHYHTYVNMHVVYRSGTEDQPLRYPDIETGSYLYFQADSNLGSNIDIFAIGNIYIIDVDDGNPNNPALSKTVKLAAPDGFIEIRGKYTSSEILTLNPKDTVRFADSTLGPTELNLPSFYLAGKTLHLLGGTSPTAPASITATTGNITLETITAVGNGTNHLTLDSIGSINIGDTVGVSDTNRVGDITVVKGDVTFKDKVYANSYTQNAGSAAILEEQDYLEFFTLLNSTTLNINNKNIITHGGTINVTGNTTVTGTVILDSHEANDHINLATVTGTGSLEMTAGDGNINITGRIGTDENTRIGNITASAYDVTFADDVFAADVWVISGRDVTFGANVFAADVLIENDGQYTQSANITANSFKQTGIGDVSLNGDITVTAATMTAAQIIFSSKADFTKSLTFTTPPTGGIVDLAQGVGGAFQLTLKGGSADSASLVLSKTSGTLGDVEIFADSYVKVSSGKTINQSGNLTLQAGTTKITTLNLTGASWQMGTGTDRVNSFTAYSGALILGTNSTLIADNFYLTGNLTGTPFAFENSGRATISVSGDVEIAGVSAVSFKVDDQPLLLIEMNGTGQQNLTVDQPLGSLRVGVNSKTVLSTNNADGTIYFRGEVIINSTAAPSGLDASDFDIVMYAGLSGKRDLNNYTYTDIGQDNIKYTRWKISNASIAQPPYESPPEMNNFVFRQNPGKKVSFQRDPYDTSGYPVFFEIAGNSMWRELECYVPGAFVQFSRHPDHHTVLQKFSIGGKESASASDHSDYVTITRLTNDENYNYPYYYDANIMSPPMTHAAGGSANVGDPGQWALPVYLAPQDLKNPMDNASWEREREKYWNINLISTPDNPLEHFRYVRVFFSHAYNQRIPIETSYMHLDAIPYYKPATHEGYFNFDWIELRKILYSFTEDSSGDGRLDRIRVQTNVSLNGDFSQFEVKIEGYEVDASKGINGFQMVREITKNDDDYDSFYIYLHQLSQIDSGSTPLWSVTRNGSLRDRITDTSPVGDPEVDIDIRPFDTIPPRVAYTLTLPGHPQTYVKMSEPVLSLEGSNISDAQAIEKSESYFFTWQYFPFDNTPVTYTLPVRSANLGYLLNMPSSVKLETLAHLNNLFGDTPTETDGYFRMDDIIDQGQRAMDWNDPSVDPAFYLYYQPPKYPLNWAYTQYAKVFGNGHLRGQNLLNPDFSEDTATPAGSEPIANVFIPPNKMLTVEMMTDLASDDKDIRASVTPSRFSSPNSVIRRVTDVLISTAPSANDSNNYFAWPVWARYNEFANPDNASLSGDFWSQRNTDNGLIWIFDGTAFLEARGIELQARINSRLSGSMEIFWLTDLPVEYRIPGEVPLRGRSTGGFWLPYPEDLRNNRFLYYFTPRYEGSAITRTSASAPDNSPLFNFEIGGENNSGKKLEFLLRINGSNGSTTSDLFVARLDIPRGGAIPENWYRLVRPFGFDIQDIRLQRGGVTILNNVINSDARENTFIRYHLVRPGRVTIQVFTLDGTLVKSLRRNEYREAGEWTDSWDGTNNSGRPVARGMYFVRVVAPDIDEIRKVMVVR